MQLRRLFFALIATAALTASTAFAGDTGSVSGAVFGPGGSLVADATVKISGELMPAGRTVTTDENGMYRFQALLPGKSTVQVEKSGVGTTSREVQVDLDKDTQVDLVIGVEVKEDVVVSAASPIVDLKSSEVNFNYKADQIAALPLQRNYSGLFQLIPGVAENNQFAPAGGGSRQDNKYLIDGVDITNPGFGYLSTEVNGLDIAEFNVKRGAITAEFGRATGFVTNAISKSGTNQFHGIGFAEMRPRSFSAKAKLSEYRRRDREDPQHHRSVHRLIQPWRSRDPRSAVLVWIRSVASQAGHRPYKRSWGCPRQDRDHQRTLRQADRTANVQDVRQCRLPFPPH